jgi:hypothetical protein
MASCVDYCDAEVGGLRCGYLVGGGWFIDVICELVRGFCRFSFGLWDSCIVGGNQGQLSKQRVCNFVSLEGR